MTVTLERPDVDERLEHDDQAPAHIFRKDDIAVSRSTGQPVTALCGEVRSITTQETAGRPVCRACGEQLNRIAAARAGLN